MTRINMINQKKDEDWNVTEKLEAYNTRVFLETTKLYRRGTYSKGHANMPFQ